MSPSRDRDGAPRILDVLASRWSPTTFDEQSSVSPADADRLLEAARWAPSAGNSQPWAFVVALRGGDEHARLVELLAPSSRRWAPQAGALVVNLAHCLVEDSDLGYSEFSLYDLGQAVAHMTIQAQSMGLSVRQFRAFDRGGVAAAFAVPPHWQVTTISAIGRPAADGLTSSGRPASGTGRRPGESLRWPAAGSRDRVADGPDGPDGPGGR